MAIWKYSSADPNAQVKESFIAAVKREFDNETVKAQLKSQIPIYQKLPLEFSMALQKVFSSNLFPSGMVTEQDIINSKKIQRVAIMVFDILKPRLSNGGKSMIEEFNDIPTIQSTKFTDKPQT